jgi:HAD superfamily hydrolase (TIGR01509 family)
VLAEDRRSHIEWTSVQGVLFDLDGTLISSGEVLRETFNGMLRAYGTVGSEAMFRECDGDPITAIAQRVRAWCNVEEPAETIAERYRTALLDSYVGQALPQSGAEDILRELARRGTKLGLVTSAERRIAAPLLHRLGWSGYFGVVVFGDDVEFPKPAPDAYSKALGLIGCAAHEAVALEDSVNGVRSAAAAGLSVLGVGRERRSGELYSAGARWVAVSLEEVLRDVCCS